MSSALMFETDATTGAPPSSEPTAQPRLRVLLAHRQPIVREGTRTILESNEGLEIVGESASLTSALPLIPALQPDVLVLGLDPAEVESRGFVRQVRSVQALTRVLVLDSGVPTRLLAQLGVSGWIASTASTVELVTAIRAAAAGHHIAGNPTLITTPPDGVRVVPTPRELEVLTLIEQGLPTRAIARELQTTARTIHFHVGNLYAKLGAHSRTELVYLARRQGWLD